LSSCRGIMGRDACDPISIPSSLSPPAHQLSNDISFTHQHIIFTASSSIRSLSSPVVCLSVRRRVVLAPLYLCSSLDMFASSHSQALLYTQKIAAIETTSIILHDNLYQNEYLSLFVPISVHINTDLLSVHVAPITLSILDMFATAFRRGETYEYTDHTFRATCISTLLVLVIILSPSSMCSLPNLPLASPFQLFMTLSS